MAILSFKVSSYALNIHMTGTQRFTPREGFTGIPSEYTPHVKAYAAKNYYVDDLDRALESGWITQKEYDDALKMKTDTDPQYRPNTLTGQPEAIPLQ